MDKKRRPRALKQICQNFAEHMFNVDTEDYRRDLDDMVVFKDGVLECGFVWTVLVNPANGHFICSITGIETKEEWITEDNKELVGTPWYDELMDMIFCQEEEETEK